MEQRNSGINNNDLVDRISDLPDSILCLILSFLHTKEVVATSILSKRWKFVWVKVHNLDFYYNRCRKDRNDGEDMKFVDFVNRVLLLHDSGILDKFCLVWKPWCVLSHADSWINTAIRKNVHELSVCLMSPVGKYDITTSVFSCDSLQSLELIGNITFISDAILICLPRLENLKLDPVYFRSEKACEKLINGCPKLNYLHLYLSYKDVYDDDYFTCIVSSASLRRLEICFVHKSVLKLNASSLEYLEVSGDISEIFVEKSSSSLVQAKFHIMLDEHELSNNSVIETIHALDCPSVTLCISERQRYWID